MKKSSLTLVSLLALSVPVFGQVASDLVATSSTGSGTHQFTQSGVTADLTLCTFELCHLDERGFLKVEHVAAGSVPSIVAQASDPEDQKFLVFYPAGHEGNRDKLRVLRNRYLVTLADGANLEEVKERCGMESIKLVREGSRLAICEEVSAGRVLGQLTNVLSDPQVVSAEPIFAKKRFKRLTPTDPLYMEQWYLSNDGTAGGVAGVDINLEAALDKATGATVTVAVVDDGIATDHDDLAANATGPHLNFFIDAFPDDPATFDIFSNHGTAVAGLIGAALNNTDEDGNFVGITGVSPGATLSGVRLLGFDGFTLIDDAQEAEALSFSLDDISIYNNSWGPIDSTLDLAAPGPLLEAAFEQGIQTGRVVGGEAKGAIYVWAGGNGGEIADRSDYDGYASSKYTIAVGALDDSGKKSSFSEQGSNLVVVAPSSGGSQGIFTTAFGLSVDEDDNPIRTSEYTADFGGTSASAPIVSGVVALMLEVNPDLNWREVQDILIRSARKIDPNDGDWIVNAAGLNFNHKYGAGLVDANAAVIMAQQRIPTDPVTDPVDDDGNLLAISGNGPLVSQERYQYIAGDPGSPVVPDNDGNSGVFSYDMSVDEAGNPQPNLSVEHVELRAEIATESRTDLEVVLISPNGTQSILHAVDQDNEEQSITDWTFMTVRNWGEGSAGTWVLRVTDRITGNEVDFISAKLTIHGVLDPTAPVSEMPILTSATFVTLDQGADFDYLIESAEPASAAVSDLPDGAVFDSATSMISGAIMEPGLYTIPITLTDGDGVDGSFSLSIVVRPTAIALGDAVGLSGTPAIFGGDASWGFETSDTNSEGSGEDGVSASSPPGLADTQSSIFGFDNLGSGVLRFDWKTSSEAGADRLWLNRGGDVPEVWDAFISGSREWATSAVVLPDFSNDVRWIYKKDATKDPSSFLPNSAGEDRGLIDNIELVGLDEYMEELADAASITGFTPEFDSRMIFYPKFFSPGFMPGDPDIMVIASPSIGNGQTASMSTWVDGPGEFSGQVLVYSDASDGFELLIDGVLFESLSGNIVTGSEFALLNINQTIPSGRHEIKLRFRKDFSGTSFGEVAGEPFEGIVMRNLSYVPDASFAAFLSDFGLPLDSDPSGDIDGDGYTNFEEYAFGGHPLAYDVPTYLPQVVGTGDNRFIEYGIDTSNLDLEYTAQQSFDLLDWVDADLTTLDRMEGDVEVYRIPVSNIAGRAKLFFRVIAENL